MAKKKKIISHWSKKKIDKKLFFGSILIALLICVFVVFVYKSPTFNRSGFSIQDYFETIYWNWKNSQPMEIPVLTPVPTSSIVNSSMIGAVKVSRSVSSLAVGANSPFIPLKEITDHATAQVLYDTIVALPPYPTPVDGRPISGSCVENAKRVLYDLTFLSYGNEPVHHAVVSMTGCGGSWWVKLDGSYKREFYSDMHLYVPFRSLFESSLGLTYSQLDGGK